jgi:hypothetical protein
MIIRELRVSPGDRAVAGYILKDWDLTIGSYDKALALSTEQRIECAAKLILLYRACAVSPIGHYDNRGVWWPEPCEVRRCCQELRNPSSSWAWTLRKHCFTTKHILMLYNVVGHRKEVLASAKAIEALVKLAEISGGSLG